MGDYKFKGKKSGKSHTIKSPDISVGMFGSSDKGVSPDINSELTFYETPIAKKGFWKGSVNANYKPSLNRGSLGVRGYVGLLDLVGMGKSSNNEENFTEMGLEFNNGQTRPVIRNQTEWVKLKLGNGNINRNKLGFFSDWRMGGFGFQGNRYTIMADQYKDANNVTQYTPRYIKTESLKDNPIGSSLGFGLSFKKELGQDFDISGGVQTDMIPFLDYLSKQIKNNNTYSDPSFDANLKLRYKIPYKLRYKTIGYTPPVVTDGQYKNTRLFNDGNPNSNFDNKLRR